MTWFPLSLQEVSRQLGIVVLPVASSAAWLGLGACSIVVLALVMERSFALRRKRIIPAGFLDEVRRYWYKGEIKSALACCETEQVAIARVLKAGLEHYGDTRQEIEKALEGAGQQELYILGSYLRGFGLIASLAPMLGFLGTVTGMIQAFNAIAAAGTSNPALVASGISEALLTTATGLVIGIPSLALFHFFRGRVDRFVQEMEEIALELLDDLVKQQQRTRRMRESSDAV